MTSCSTQTVDASTQLPSVALYSTCVRLLRLPQHARRSGRSIGSKAGSRMSCHRRRYALARVLFIKEGEGQFRIQVEPPSTEELIHFLIQYRITVPTRCKGNGSDLEIVCDPVQGGEKFFGARSTTSVGPTKKNLHLSVAKLLWRRRSQRSVAQVS
jgi:hypothetical protein